MKINFSFYNFFFPTVLISRIKKNIIYAKLQLKICLYHLIIKFKPFRNSIKCELYGRFPINLLLINFLKKTY